MHKLYELREKLMEELEGCTKKNTEMNAQSLDTVYKLIESIKGIDKIFMLNGVDDEHSQKYGNSYGYHRDGMGRFSGNRWTITSGSGYPRYSRTDRKEMTIGMLEDLKSRAPSGKALEAIDTVMAQLRLDE